MRALKAWWRDLKEGIRVLGFWHCMYLRHVYRHHMRLIHRHGQHWFKKYGPCIPGGLTFERCEWCGETINVSTVESSDGV